MAAALYSGCDFFTYWSTAPTDVSGTQYGGTNQNGSIGPAATTFMSFVGQYVDVITSAQLTALNDAGLSVYFYYENGSRQSNAYFAGLTSSGAYNAGVADAGTVQSSLSGLGLATNWPVYFAIDFDADSTAVVNITYYFSGIIDTIGAAANVGIYGSGYCCTEVNLGLVGMSYPYLGYFIQSRSTGYTGNGNYLDTTTGTTQNLWQWPPGYTPSGNQTINGHGVDGVFAYTTYFGQYPAGSSGNLTYAFVPNPAVTYTQPNPQSIIVPKYIYDHVLFSDTFSVSLSESSWPFNVAGPATSINQYAYPIGNFTAVVNGGAESTNDFGFIYSTDYGSYLGNLPAVVVQPIVDSSGDVSFDVTYTIGGAATIDLTINFALMASYNPTSLPATSVQQATAYSNIIPGGLPTPYAAYRRIKTDSYVGTGSTTFTHGLSTIPNLLYWVGDNSGDIDMQPVEWTSVGEGSKFGLAMDDTYVYIYVDSANNSNAYYRIYLDN